MRYFQPEGDIEKIDFEILENSDPGYGSNYQEQILSISMEEVENALKKLANGKAAGVHRIKAEAYKFGGLAVKSVLTSFYNLCGKTQITFSAWKESIIIPIFKNTGTKTGFSAI